MNEPDGDDSPPLASIRNAELAPSIVSNLTTASDEVPLTAFPRLLPRSIGQPNTPLKSANNAFGGDVEEGYDSDNQCGPFIADGADNEEFYNMDEATPEAPIEAVPALDEGGNEDAVAAEIVLDKEAIHKLNVALLREELRKRGLRVTGLKAVLQTRLIEAVENGVVIQEEQPRNEVNNQACNSFQPGTYWKLLEAKGEKIDASCRTCS